MKRKGLSLLLCTALIFSLSVPGNAEEIKDAEFECMAAETMENELQSLNSYTEGKDYSSGSAFFEADSETEAREIADDYGAELESFDSGVGVISFDGSVEDKLEDAVSTMSVKTPIYPDFFVETDDYMDGGDILEALSESEEAEVQATSSDPDYSYQWFHEKINSEEAWDVSNGTGVKVAVIDNCFQADHEDLADNVAATYNAADGSDDVSVSSNITNSSHGTHVAGIIGAVSNNDLLGTGVAPDCDLYLVKIASSNGSLLLSSVIKAIKWSAAQGVDVINMSIGTSSITQSTEELLQEAIDDAVDSGAVVTVAAGNSGNDAVYYPAACDNVIAVAAIGEKAGDHAADDTVLASYSNYGAYVDIAAPGTNIYSTVPTSSAKDLSGTSMAAPVVAGVAALVYSADQELMSANSSTASKTVMSRILSSTDGKTYSCSSTGGSVTGCVDAEKALASTASYTAPSFYVKLKDKTVTNGGTYWITAGKKEKLVITDSNGKKIKAANKKNAATYTVAGSSSFTISNKTLKCSKDATAYSSASDKIASADTAWVTVSYNGEKVRLKFIALGKIKAAGYFSGNKLKRSITRTVSVGNAVSMDSIENLAGCSVEYWLKSGKDYTSLGSADSLGYSLKIPAKASKNEMIKEDSDGNPLTFTPSKKGSYIFRITSPGTRKKFKIKIKVTD